MSHIPGHIGHDETEDMIGGAGNLLPRNISYQDYLASSRPGIVPLPINSNYGYGLGEHPNPWNAITGDVPSHNVIPDNRPFLERLKDAPGMGLLPVVDTWSGWNDMGPWGRALSIGMNAIDIGTAGASKLATLPFKTIPNPLSLLKNKSIYQEINLPQKKYNYDKSSNTGVINSYQTETSPTTQMFIRRGLPPGHPEYSRITSPLNTPNQTTHPFSFGKHIPPQEQFFPPYGGEYLTSENWGNVGGYSREAGVSSYIMQPFNRNLTPSTGSFETSYELPSIYGTGGHSLHPPLATLFGNQPIGAEPNPLGISLDNIEWVIRNPKMNLGDTNNPVTMFTGVKPEDFRAYGDSPAEFNTPRVDKIVDLQRENLIRGNPWIDVPQGKDIMLESSDLYAIEGYPVRELGSDFENLFSSYENIKRIDPRTVAIASEPYSREIFSKIDPYGFEAMLGGMYPLAGLQNIADDIAPRLPYPPSVTSLTTSARAINEFRDTDPIPNDAVVRSVLGDAGMQAEMLGGLDW